MHEQARNWVKNNLPGSQRLVVEFGSLNINGGIRDLLNCQTYIGVDMQEGPGVDVIGDAATWRGDELADLVVCCEVFEHTPEWPEIIRNAAANLEPGGVFIATAAGPGRAPHSARRESGPDPDEWYRNVDPDELKAELIVAGFGGPWVDVAGTDVRCVARKDL